MSEETKERQLEAQVVEQFEKFLDGKDLCCIVTARRSLRFVSMLREAQRLDAEIDLPDPDESA